jgi:predicted enzyme related to lactoylglutathione lyase
MHSRLVTITVDCHDPAKLAAFWAQVLGTNEGEEDGENVYIARADAGPDLYFQRVPESKTVKNRVHLDLTPPSTMQEEVDRLTALGATVQRLVEEGGIYWTVMLDPEGNEFCILRSDSERGVTS